MPHVCHPSRGSGDRASLEFMSQSAKATGDFKNNDNPCLKGG